MSGLVCLKCNAFFRPEKTGAYIEEGRPLDSTGDNWGPYKLWMCDIACCPCCGARIAHGFARQPIAEHFQSDYAEHVDYAQPIVRVDDCGGHMP